MILLGPNFAMLLNYVMKYSKHMVNLKCLSGLSVVKEEITITEHTTCYRSNALDINEKHHYMQYRTISLADQISDQGMKNQLHNFKGCCLHSQFHKQTSCLPVYEPTHQYTAFRNEGIQAATCTAHLHS
jgi:hypothetical protein